MPYCTVLYCTVLYCTVLYCTVLYCTVLSLLQEAALARMRAQQAAFMQCTDDTMDTDGSEDESAAAAAAGAGVPGQAAGQARQQQQEQQKSGYDTAEELAALASAAAGLLPEEAYAQQQQQQQQQSVSVVSCGLQELSGECVVCRAADSSKGPLAMLAFVQVRICSFEEGPPSPTGGRRRPPPVGAGEGGYNGATITLTSAVWCTGRAIDS
jgi:hypothetical protein